MFKLFGLYIDISTLLKNFLYDHLELRKKKDILCIRQLAKRQLNNILFGIVKQL